METIGQFFIYALMGIFVENAVFTRALGVGRVIFIGNIRHIGIYCAFLTATTSFSSLIAYAVQNIFYDYPNILAYRPLFFVLGMLVLYFAFYFIFSALFREQFREISRILVLAVFNCAVLGTMMLLTSTQRSLSAYVGFGIGTGVGYTFAALLLESGRRKLQIIPLPRAFKGLPALLLYVGLISLAFYGLIGHQLPT